MLPNRPSKSAQRSAVEQKHQQGVAEISLTKFHAHKQFTTGGKF